MLTSDSSEEFLSACLRFSQTKQQGHPNDLARSFLRSLEQPKQVNTALMIYEGLKIKGASYLFEIQLNNEEKEIADYEYKLEGSKEWQGIAQQMQQQLRLIDMERQRVVNQIYKERQDAINSFKLFIQNHLYIFRKSNDLSQYRLFLIVYLIFGLRTIIICRKHQNTFAINGGAYRQPWRNRYMSKRVHRYFQEAKILYKSLENEQTSASYDFLFSLIGKNIIDQSYVESLCILFNIHYKTYQPVHAFSLERQINTKAESKPDFLKLFNQNRGKINSNRVAVKFRHCQVDENNQMQKYRILEIRSKENSQKVEQILSFLHQLSAYKFQKHTSSTDDFYLDINPFFKKDFIHQQQSPKLKKNNHQIFNSIANAFINHFGPFRCFYSTTFNIICLLDFDESSVYLHEQWKRQCLSSYIVSISAKKVILNVTIDILEKEKYSTLKIFYLNVKDMKFQGKILQINQKEQTFIQKIFSNILHIVRNLKCKAPVTKYAHFLNIKKKTRKGTSQMDIYHLRGIDKKFMIQKCCNIFLQVMEQLKLKMSVTLLQISLYLIRLSYAFIEMRKGTTTRFKNNERDIYNSIKHFVGYGIKKQQISQIEQSMDISNYDQVLSNVKEIFERHMEVTQFYDFGLFWSYIKTFEFFMNKYTKTAIYIPGKGTPRRAIRINPTVSSLCSRMLKQCLLFYCLENQYKLQYLDLQIYYIALLYGQSIKMKLQKLGNISRQQREELIRPVAIIARMIKNKVNNIWKCSKETKIIDVMAIAEELDKQVKRIYRFNIPYTKETFEEWFDERFISEYAKYSCKECQLCRHFNNFFFEGQDCFSRFPECLKLIFKKINVNYTKGYEEITHELFKY